MSPAEVLKIFEAAGALQQGHFGLSSGNHSNRYLQCALVTQYPRFALAVAQDLAAPFVKLGVEVVLGPALGGVVIAQEVAQALYRAGLTGVRAIFCERVEGRLTLRRGFSLKPGERVLAVEDVVTTGGSLKETLELARLAQAQIVGAACLVDRSPAPPDLGTPLTSLLKIAAEIYPANACPLCQAGVPLSKPGSRSLA